VTTPWPATIRYRGPLLDYGNVVILEPGGGVLLVLAGLSELFGDTGEVLPAGAPVGLMGGETPDTEALLAASGEGSGGQLSETLYMELREGRRARGPRAVVRRGLKDEDPMKKFRHGRAGRESTNSSTCSATSSSASARNMSRRSTRAS
jgi:hypothetical protein